MSEYEFIESPDGCCWFEKKAKHPSDAAACSDVWEYSQYRASLHRNGVTFALMTRDGKHSLNPEEQAILLAALNRPNAESIHPEPKP